MGIANPTIAELFIDKMFEAGATLHVTVEGYRFRKWVETPKFRPKIAHSLGWDAYRFEDFQPSDDLKKLFKRNRYEIEDHCAMLVELWKKEIAEDRR